MMEVYSTTYLPMRSNAFLARLFTGQSGNRPARWYLSLISDPTSTPGIQVVGGKGGGKIRLGK
jgi:hypothetical protein